jgi:hypothetical protein
MMLSFEEKLRIINDEIEGLESAKKYLQHEIEVAEFIEDDQRVRRNKESLETCNKMIDRYKDKLEKVSLDELEE